MITFRIGNLLKLAIPIDRVGELENFNDATDISVVIIHSYYPKEIRIVPTVTNNGTNLLATYQTVESMRTGQYKLVLSWKKAGISYVWNPELIEFTDDSQRVTSTSDNLVDDSIILRGAVYVNKDGANAFEVWKGIMGDDTLTEQDYTDFLQAPAREAVEQGVLVLAPYVDAASGSAAAALQAKSESVAAKEISVTKAGEAGTSAAAALQAKSESVAAKEISVTKAGEAGTSAAAALQAKSESVAAKEISVTKAGEAGTSAAAALQAKSESVAAKEISVTKAGEAGTSAAAALQAKSESVAAKEISVTKAGEAGTSAAAALQAKSESVAAKEISVTKAGEAGTSAQTANTKAIEAAASAAAFPTTHPEVSFAARVIADLGVINTQLVNRIYSESQAKNASIYYLLSGAYKARVSGINQYVNKAYDFSPNSNDALNSTDATQSFLDGYINKANLGIKYVSGQTQTGVLTIGTAKTFSATESWTFRIVLKPNFKGGARIALGATSYLELNAGTIILHNGAIAILTGTHTTVCGLKTIIEFQYGGGAVGLIKVNNTPVPTVALSAAMDFSRISYLSANKLDSTIYAFSVFPYRCSESESVKEYTFLRSVFPDAETVVINGYEITTQNSENIIMSDGTVVPNITINTMAENPELVVNGSFDNGATGWTVTGNDATHLITFSGGQARYQSDTTSPVLSLSQTVAAIGKIYKVVVDIASITSGGLKLAGILRSGAEQVLTAGVNTIYGTSAAQVVGIYRTAANTDALINSVSIKEIGWDASILIYDSTYAATQGSASVKTLAAQKAAAMYSVYNNDPLLGAINGKIFNWFAGVCLAPIGWHLPSQQEWIQIYTYLGGSSVAGGKMKKTGLEFWNTPNSGATNESGFSGIGSGDRSASGIFEQIKYQSWFLSSGTDAYRLTESNAALTAGSFSGANRAAGGSIRYIRNIPYGDQIRTVSNATITNIASVALNTGIPWGYRPKAIRIVSTTNLTLIEAKLLNTSSAVMATLITGKSCNATDITFPITADFSVGYTDYSVALTATGNTDLGLQIFILLEKTPS